jgi:RHS repeat-associated protein
MDPATLDTTAQGAQIAIRDIALPKGGGSVGYGESFRLNPFTGAAQFSIPVATPAARSTVLELDLAYTSGGANGPYGLGFSLPLSAISVRTSKGIPRYDGSEIYLLDGDVLVPRYDRQDGRWTLGARQVQQGATYRVVAYRRQSEGRYDRIEHWTDQADGSSFWQITDRNNRTTVLGRSAGARIADPADASRIGGWLVEEQLDAAGNKIVYSYLPEDAAGLSPSQARHNSTANRYPARIRYGNYLDAQGSEQFAFQVILDYGERDLDHPSVDPPKPWAPRPDPFSSFRFGFEVRINRLCSGILIAHAFPDELGPDPVVVSVFRLAYAADQGLSLMTEITRTGFRRDADGVTRRKSHPPIKLDYTAWKPEQSAFQDLAVSEGGAIPGLIDGGGFQMVDLYGGGRPGILAVQGRALSYFEPNGDARYSPGVPPPQFPLNMPRGDHTAALMDIGGNGKLDLVIAAPGRSGYYGNNNDTTWTSFQPLENVPTEFSDGNTRLVDLTGSGLTDLLSGDQSQWRVALSKGTAGFADVMVVPVPDDIGGYDSKDASVFVGFADMFGDGLSHLVRVSDGRVQVWPNFGYGCFGQPREILGAPPFGPTMTARQVLLADVNGSGAADLILVHGDHIAIHPNIHGNGFGPALKIPLPDGFSALDRVNATDVLGLGTSAIVVSQALPDAVQRYLDTCGGVRPFLLRAIDNGMGAATTIAYRSSSAYALADRQAAMPWVTSLAMPVQVVSHVDEVDGVDGITHSQAYEYRDGYYDPVEREFRGFRMLQTQDSTTINDSVWHFPMAVALPPGAEQIEPLLRRAWTTTGAFPQSGAIADQLKTFCFDGDPQALQLPDPVFDPQIMAAGGDTVRQAFMALAGRSYRTEDYGVAPNGLPRTTPYRIGQSAFAVRLIQPIIGDNYAVFQVVERESALCDYEASENDPRISHRLNVAHDDFGQAVRSAEVFYRRLPGTMRLPGQTATLFQLHTTGLINHVDGGYDNGSGSPIAPLHQVDGAAFHIFALPFESRSYEVAGFPEPAPYFSYDQAEAIAAQAIANTIPFGAAFTTGGTQGRLFKWTQDLFWNDELTAPAALQQVAATMLIHHRQTAVLSAQLVAGVFGARVSDATLQQVGYHSQDGYWWSWDHTASYLGAPGFYQIEATTDPFGNTLSVTYDRYRLAIVTQADPTGHVTTVGMDYQALKPAAVTDINQNVSEALYDALAQVMVTGLHRVKDGNIVGDAPLAQYVIGDDATTASVLADPAKYLQQAGHYFHQDLTAWRGGTGCPPNTLLIERHMFANPETSQSRTTDAHPFGVAIAFFDGLLRQISIATLVNGDPPYALEPSSTTTRMNSPADASWAVDHRVRYDHRGDVAVEYLPFFSTTPAFVPAPDVPHAEFCYDALGRQIQTLTAKGFLTRRQYTAWSAVHSDADDTVTDSPYYQAHINDPQLPPAERQALQKAAVFAGTASTEMLDVMGRTIQEVQLLVSTASPQQTPLCDYCWLDAAGSAIATTDPRFYNSADPANPAFYTSLATYDMEGRALDQRSADAGNQPLSSPQTGAPIVTLHDALGQEVSRWDPRGYLTSRFYNPLRQLARVHVTGNGLDQDVEVLQYGADASSQTVNRLVAHYDQAGIFTVPAYSLTGEPISHSRRFRVDSANEANWNDLGSVALEPEMWSTTYAYDAVGNVLTIAAPNGSIVSRSYFRNQWLKTVAVAPSGSVTPVPAVQPVTYMASGDPATLVFGNGVTTQYGYEAETLRLTSIVSTLPDGRTVAQNLAYTYDPHGNVTFLASATPVPGAGNSAVPGDGDYTFDSLYRLVGASGRQAAGLGPTSCLAGDTGFAPTVTLEPYTQTYAYDWSGNLFETVQGGGTPWTRTLTVSPSSNHAVPSGILSGKKPDDFFDPGGNLTGLETGAVLSYDAAGRLFQVAGADGRSCFQYAWTNHRARKVEARNGTTTETLYVDDVVIERTASIQATSADPTVSLRVAFGDRLVLVLVFPSEGAAPLWRYQLEDRIWSVGLELDADAAVLTFEEYQPYGCTAVSTATAGTSAPRYRFVQQELDDGTGLYAIGRRHYIPSQARWTSPDPAGDVDGPNLFMYVRGNPVARHDLTGECGHPPATQDKQDKQPSFVAKKGLKAISAFGTAGNAVLDAYVNNRELVHKFLYPYPGSPASIHTSAFHAAVLSKVGFFAVTAGFAGVLTSGLSIKKEGLTRDNGLMLFAQSMFMAEGVTFYSAMRHLHHKAFEKAIWRAGVFGTIADSVKAYKYFSHSEYITGTSYLLLAAGNFVPLFHAKSRTKLVRMMMRSAPFDKRKIAALARLTRPSRTLLMGGLMLPVANSLYSSAKARLFPTHGKESEGHQ